MIFKVKYNTQQLLKISFEVIFLKIHIMIMKYTFYLILIH